jgi:hypothetical protein
MIHSGRAGPEGSLVELRRGDHVIVARVVWSDGARVGLRSDDQLPVDEILSVSCSKSLQLVAADGTRVERRKQPRTKRDDARLRGRMFDFVGVTAIGASLALAGWFMVERALARPLAQVARALDSQL